MTSLIRPRNLYKWLLNALSGNSSSFFYLISLNIIRDSFFKNKKRRSSHIICFYRDFLGLWNISLILTNLHLIRAIKNRGEKKKRIIKSFQIFDKFIFEESLSSKRFKYYCLLVFFLKGKVIFISFFKQLLANFFLKKKSFQ